MTNTIFRERSLVEHLEMVVIIICCVFGAVATMKLFELTVAGMP